MHYRWNAGEGGLVRVLTFILSPSIHPRCPRATGPREKGEERARARGEGTIVGTTIVPAQREYRDPRREGVLYCTSWMWLRGDNRVRAFGILSPPSSLLTLLPALPLSSFRSVSLPFRRALSVF